MTYEEMCQALANAYPAYLTLLKNKVYASGYTMGYAKLEDRFSYNGGNSGDYVYYGPNVGQTGFVCLIDITKYKRIEFDCYMSGAQSSANGFIRLGIFRYPYEYTNVNITSVQPSNTSLNTVVIDISSYTGNVYLGCVGWSSGTNRPIVYIKEIRLYQ